MAGGWIALATAMLIAIIPVPYRPSRECVLQATNRHFVASPIEGRLIEAEVRPGDEVKAGQILARMEDLQLQRELAGAESALESASKKRDIALASEMTSDLRLAQLEFQQMRIKVEALKDRLQEMTIVCPADGIVLQGDWQGNNGRPVSFGQTLFEIGSLDDMAAEIQLLSDDLPWVQVGSGALLKPEGSDMQSWRGKVARIEPQATILEEQAVFLAEMQIENKNHGYRPGMKMTASVDAGWHSIAWVLFRKPYRWFVNQWVW